MISRFVQCSMCRLSFGEIILMPQIKRTALTGIKSRIQSDWFRSQWNMRVDALGLPPLHPTPFSYHQLLLTELLFSRMLYKWNHTVCAFWDLCLPLLKMHLTHILVVITISGGSFQALSFILIVILLFLTHSHTFICSDSSFNKYL